MLTRPSDGACRSRTHPADGHAPTQQTATHPPSRRPWACVRPTHFPGLGGRRTSLSSRRGTGTPQGPQPPPLLPPAGRQPPAPSGKPRLLPDCRVRSVTRCSGGEGSWWHRYSLRRVPGCQDAAKDNGAFKMSIKNSWYYETQQNQPCAEVESNYAILM